MTEFRLAPETTHIHVRGGEEGVCVCGGGHMISHSHAHTSSQSA